jgi:hypothetical protein
MTLAGTSSVINCFSQLGSFEHSKITCIQVDTAEQRKEPFRRHGMPPRQIRLKCCHICWVTLLVNKRTDLTPTGLHGRRLHSQLQRGQ